MDFIDTGFQGLYLIKHDVITDERGKFTRTFCKKESQKICFSKEFVQFNTSVNIKKGTIRGLHYQEPPYGETKLIRCVNGKILDVVVDIRRNSPTFLKYYSVELNDSLNFSLLVPEGFAHGFQTLTDNAIIIYHHTNYFTIGVDRGLRYNDPLLKIKWELPVSNISVKDKNLPFLNDNFEGLKL